MAGPNAGSGLIFNGNAATAGSVTPPVTVGQMFMASFQTYSAGTNIVTVDVQVSNVPSAADGYIASTGVPARDDSFASTDWVTVSTNAISASAQARMDVIAYVPQRVARLRLQATTAAVACKVWVRTQGNE